MASTDLYDTLSQPVIGYDIAPAGSGFTAFSFTSAASGGTLDSLSINLRDATAATDGGTVAVSLYSSTSSGPSAPGALLGVIATLSDTVLSASGGVVSVPLSSAFALTAGTRYWVQVSGSASSKVQIGYEVAASGTGASTEFFYENGQTHADSEGASIAQVTENVACYCTGTLILTDRGEKPVESLRIGDLVATASGGLEPIRWIGRRSYAGRFLQRNPAMLPVSIAAGALGNGLPRRMLRISPNHAMLLDGVLVAAKDLVNGMTIARERSADQVDYVHLELEQHDAVLAEGAASETFVDDGSRAMFHNLAETAAPSAPASVAFCAPRVDSGHELDAIRRRLEDVASGLIVEPSVAAA